MTFLETKDILTLRKPRSQRVSVSPRPAEVISFCKSKTSYVNKLVRTHGLLFGHWQPTFCVECTLHINVGQGKTVIGCNGLDVFSPDVFSTGACQAMTFQVWRPCARKSSRRSSHSRGWRSRRKLFWKCSRYFWKRKKTKVRKCSPRNRTVKMHLLLDSTTSSSAAF